MSRLQQQRRRLRRGGRAPRTVAVRDSKDPHGPALAFSREGLRAFTRRVKAGA